VDPGQKVLDFFQGNLQEHFICPTYFEKKWISQAKILMTFLKSLTPKCPFIQTKPEIDAYAIKYTVGSTFALGLYISITYEGILLMDPCFWVNAFKTTCFGF